MKLAERLDTARSLHGQGRLAEAEAAYHALLAEAPDDPNALHLLGVVLTQRGDAAGGAAAMRRSLAVQPGQPVVYANLGNARVALNAHDAALESYERALEALPDYAPAHYGRGNALFALGRYAAAEASYRRATEIAPGFLAAQQRRAQALSMLNQHQTVLGVCRTLQLRCARQFALRSRIEAPPLWRGERYRHERLRIAYVSEDFRSHPASYLMVGLFERHDRQRFETIAISLRPPEATPFGDRVRAAFDRFVDVSACSEAAIAATMRELEVDIAIDLMGYTGSGLHSLWARRPAPIHVSYIGYAGTMGTRDMDYLLADGFLIPAGSERYYDEQVVRLPVSYQPNDDRRAIGAPVTRADAGLPADAFVWCSFNNAYKLNPPLFDVWMRLLHAVSRMAGSVLSGMGLPELITPGLDDYAALCIALARHAGTLFDTDRTRRHVEAAYRRMWSGFIGGAAPAAFDVEPLP